MQAIPLQAEEAELAEDNLKMLRGFLREEIVPVETIDDAVYEADQAMPLEHVLEIFVRVNQGGTKLSRSDLMFSLIKTKWVAARGKFDALLTEVARIGEVGIDKDFLILALQAVADVPIETDVTVVDRHWGTMDPKFPAMGTALKTALDFCRSTDARILTAKLLPVNTLVPLVYFLSRQANGSVPEDQRHNLRSMLYFLLFNEFIRGKSPSTRIRYLRDVLKKSPAAAVPLDAVLAEVAKRQRGPRPRPRSKCFSGALLSP